MVFIETARGTDYSMALDQYGIYSKFMGWEDLEKVLETGNVDEAK